jgi:transcriptional regulator with XRE-family HTH domain
MEIGKLIKELRTNIKMTQAELAKRSGVDFTTISKLEKGSRPGNIATHRKLAKALGTTLSELYREMDEPSRPVLEVNSIGKHKSDIFYYNKKATSQILLERVSSHKMTPEMLFLEKTGATHIEQKPHGTEQFIFILEGSLEIKIGETVSQLKKGESIYFNASLPHLIKNVSSKTARALRITTPAAL